MVQYGECGESEYTKITLANLFDLRYSRILQGDILSIDELANTASIVIAEECPEIEGRDLSAVPFFYHCESSTGTIEDLANGHLAFRAYDRVLVLLVPENGDTEERLFIIGHADIRDLKKCEDGDYILLSYKPWYDTNNNYFCLFDVAAGTVLEMNGVEPLDEGSPDVPPLSGGRCMGPINIAYNWLFYNFEPVTSSPITVPYDDEGWTEQETYGSHVYAYGGHDGAGIVNIEESFTGGFFGQRPKGASCEDWYTPGNGGFSASSYGEMIPTTDADIFGGEATYTFHGIGYAPVSYRNGDACGILCPEFLYTFSKWLGTLDDADLAYSITDSLSSNTYKIKMKYRKETLIECTTETEPHIYLVDGYEYLGEDYTSMSTETIDCTLEWDFSDFGVTSGVWALGSSTTLEYVRLFGEPHTLTENGDHLIGFEDAPVFRRPQGGPIRVGRKGFYFLGWASMYGRRLDAKPSNDPRVMWGDNSLNNYYKAPGATIGHVMQTQPLYFDGLAKYGLLNPYFTTGWSTSVINNSSVIAWKVAPCPLIAMFTSEIIDEDGQVKMDDCVSNVDKEKSVALGDALVEMCERAYTAFKTTEYNGPGYMTIWRKRREPL